MSILLDLGKVALRKVFTQDTLVQKASNSMEEQRTLRPVPTTLASAVALLAAWHFIVFPVLSYLFPDVGFPPLTVDIINLVPTLIGM